MMTPRTSCAKLAASRCTRVRSGGGRSRSQRQGGALEARKVFEDCLDLRGYHLADDMPLGVGDFKDHVRAVLLDAGLEVAQRTLQSALPSWLSDLPTLERLRIEGYNSDGGYSSKVLCSVETFTRLQTLDLSGCKRLTTIPGWMGSLTGLQQLNLDRCSGLAEFLPRRLLRSRCAGDVVSFLRDVSNGMSVLDVVKVVLVGEAKSGKSSLADSLSSGQPSLRPPDDRTVGIDVRRWLPDPTLSVVARVYDAAGQRVYRATHGLCTSAGALYVLAISPFELSPVDTQSRLKSREDAEEEIWSWLEAVQVQVPGACFAVIWTHLDDMPLNEAGPWLESANDGTHPSSDAPPRDVTDLDLLPMVKSAMTNVAAKLSNRVERDIRGLREAEEQFRKLFWTWESVSSWVKLSKARDEAVAGWCSAIRKRMQFAEDADGTSLRHMSKIEDLHRQMEELESKQIPENLREEHAAQVKALARARADILRHCFPVLCAGASLRPRGRAHT